MELDPFGIGVSVLCPGFVATQIANSRRTRSADKYGDDAVEDDTITAANTAVAAGIPAEVVGERVVECILENRLYAFTHPEFKDPAQARFDRMAADFEAAATSASITGVDADVKERQLAASDALVEGMQQQ